MSVTLVPVTGFQQNCSILRCSRTGAGAVVDPGGDLARVIGAIERTKTKVELIL